MASSQTGSSASYLCWTLDVGRSALATPKLLAYAGSTFFFRHGRVAESGLRHSTRNRAWGNPPWVRIPPLPPWFRIAELHDTISNPEREDEIRANFNENYLTDGGPQRLAPQGEKFLKNVTILDLPRVFSVLHIVCPLDSHAITCC